MERVPGYTRSCTVHGEAHETMGPKTGTGTLRRRAAADTHINNKSVREEEEAQAQSFRDWQKVSSNRRH